MRSLDIQSVIERSHAHQRFRVGGIDLCNLPQFEELPEEEGKGMNLHDTLLYKEIDRLIAAANALEAPDFSGLRTTTSASREDYGKLVVEAAWHVIHNLAILQYRSSFLVVRELSGCWQNRAVLPVFSSALATLRSRRLTLVSRFACSSSPYIQPDDSADWADDKLSPQVYDIIVDHVTASVAHSVHMSAEGPDWSSNCLAILARIGLALKHIKKDAKTYAERCMWDTVDLHEDLKYEHDENNRKFTFESKDTSSGDYGDILDDSLYVKDYFIEQYPLRMSISHILTRVFEELTSLSTTPGRMLEAGTSMCTFIPGTYEEDALAVSSTSREGITFSASRFALSFATTSSKNLRRWATRKRCNAKDVCDKREILKWLWRTSQVSDGDGEHVCIKTIEDAVTVTVYLALSSADTAHRLTELVHIISSQLGSKGAVSILMSPNKVSSAFVLTSRRDNLPADPAYGKVRELSDFAIRQLNVDSQSDDAETDPGREVRMAYQRHVVNMLAWSIRTDTIEVPCLPATLQILLPAFSLAALGVVLFASPYQKPRGVDPSNLMIFLWSLSLSFLLVCKAFFVPDWAWHDFIRGKVVCGSVSEIKRISGIKDQAIIMHLLRQTYPPHINSGFARPLFAQRRRATPKIRAEEAIQVATTDGFSIDRPISLKTLYAAGFIVLMVETWVGQKLVCVDCRTAGRSLLVKTPQAEEHIVGDFEADKAAGGDREIRIELKLEALTWYRVHGLYLDGNCSFV